MLTTACRSLGSRIHPGSVDDFLRVLAVMMRRLIIVDGDRCWVQFVPPRGRLHQQVPLFELIRHAEQQEPIVGIVKRRALNLREKPRPRPRGRLHQLVRDSLAQIAKGNAARRLSRMPLGIGFPPHCHAARPSRNSCSRQADHARHRRRAFGQPSFEGLHCWLDQRMPYVIQKLGDVANWAPWRSRTAKPRLAFRGEKIASELDQLIDVAGGVE